MQFSCDSNIILPKRGHFKTICQFQHVYDNITYIFALKCQEYIVLFISQYYKGEFNMMPWTGWCPHNLLISSILLACTCVFDYHCWWYHLLQYTKFCPLCWNLNLISFPFVKSKCGSNTYITDLYLTNPLMVLEKRV